MTVYIYGWGSIGRRHASTLRKIYPKCDVVVVRRSICHDVNEEGGVHFVEYGSEHRTDLSKAQAIIIATPSSLHVEALRDHLPRECMIYCEKPVVTDIYQYREVVSLLRESRAITQVGLNLRFLPEIRKLRSDIASGKFGNIVRVSFEVGYWLPSWRKNTDYESSYSARSKMGGGVVFDLFHEIDLAHWLFGPLNLEGVLGGKYSSLNIDSEDSVCVLASNIDKIPITISLDYVCQQLIRRITVVGDLCSSVLDIAAKTVSKISFEGQSIFKSCFNTEQTYIDAITDMIECGYDKTRSTLAPLESVMQANLFAVQVNDFIRGRK